MSPMRDLLTACDFVRLTPLINEPDYSCEQTLSARTPIVGAGQMVKSRNPGQTRDSKSFQLPDCRLSCKNGNPTRG